MPNSAEEILIKLKAFEEKLLAEQYTSEEYNELLKITGISDREIGILKDSFDSYLTRAEGFIQHKLFNEAISELKSARLIYPKDIKVNLNLSKCYFELFKISQKDDFRKESEKLAHFVLKLDADNKDALVIISELKKESNHNTTQKKNVIKSRFSFVAFMFVSALIVMLVYQLGKKPSFNTFNTKKGDEISLKNTENKKTILNIPVELNSDKKEHKLDLEIRHAQLLLNDDLRNSQFINFSALVSSSSSIKLLILNFIAIDTEGREIFSQKIYPVIPQKGSRPNDKIYIYVKKYLEKKTSTLKKIKLEVHEIKTLTNLTNYPAARQLKIIKKYPQTDPVTDLNIWERDSEFSFNPYTKSILHSLTVEIENTGKTLLNDVQAMIKWYDKSKQLINSEKWLINNNIELRPGDRIPVYSVINLKKDKADVAYYEIEIMNTEQR